MKSESEKNGNQIIVSHLDKQIDGIPILSDISVTLEQGRIYGFIGKNGSGKTMFFRMLAGLVAPSSGEIRYNGQTVPFGGQIPFKIGLMIENAGLYPNFSALDNLQFFASIRSNLPLGVLEENIAKVGLDPKDKRKIKKYSLGMRQRLTFAQAVMESPELLLLDEPTNALDAGGVELIRNIILEEKERGAIICIASHNAEDIAVLCDETYRIVEGKFERQNEAVKEMAGERE